MRSALFASATTSTVQNNGNGSSLKRREEHDQQQNDKILHTVLTSWSDVLDQFPSSRLRDKEGNVAAQARGACALAILTILFDITSLVVVLFFVEQSWGKLVSYLLASVSAVFAISAGACAILSMNNGAHGVISGGVGNVSGSLLFAVCGRVVKSSGRGAIGTEAGEAQQ